MSLVNEYTVIPIIVSARSAVRVTKANIEPNDANSYKLMMAYSFNLEKLCVYFLNSMNKSFLVSERQTSDQTGPRLDAENCK